jgi:phosphatidate cytidylyltransferase
VFRTRFLTAILFLPLVAASVTLGGVWFFALAFVFTTLAVIEFCQLMQKIHFQPALAFSIALLWILLLDAQLSGWRVLGHRLLDFGVSLILLLSVAWHLTRRGNRLFLDWSLTLIGPLYVGWLGSYFIRLRALPSGFWWVLVAVSATWSADAGAYFAGRAWGRRLLAPSISPNKTWEGWLAGIVLSAFSTMGMVALWDVLAPPAGLDMLAGFTIGAAVGAVTLLGDLTVSVIKRQVGVKDTGSLLPGHGGALDRLDSLLWAGVIVYYIASWLIDL